MGLFKDYGLNPIGTLFAWKPTRISTTGKLVWLRKYNAISVYNKASGHVVLCIKCLPVNRDQLVNLVILKIEQADAVNKTAAKLNKLVNQYYLQKPK